MSNEHTTKMTEIMTNQLALAQKKLADMTAQQAQIDLAIHDLNRVITGIKRMLSALTLEAQPQITETELRMEDAAHQAINDAVANLSTTNAAA